MITINNSSFLVVPYDIDKSKLKSSKFLVQKIWRSYKVNSDYKLVNLPAFNSGKYVKKNRWAEERLDPEDACK